MTKVTEARGRRQQRPPRPNPSPATPSSASSASSTTTTTSLRLEEKPPAASRMTDGAEGALRRRSIHTRESYDYPNRTQAQLRVKPKPIKHPYIDQVRFSFVKNSSDVAGGTHKTHFTEQTFALSLNSRNPFQKSGRTKSRSNPHCLLTSLRCPPQNPIVFYWTTGKYVFSALVFCFEGANQIFWLGCVCSNMTPSETPPVP